MLRRISFAGFMLLTATLFVRAQGGAVDPKDVIRKAIAAHGGETELSKYRAGKSKYKGTMSLLGMEVNVSSETAFQKPDKMRTSMTLDVAGKQIDVVTVFDGTKFWVSSQGVVKQIDDEKAIAQVRESLQAEGGGLVDFLKDPAFQLTPLGDARVKDRDVVGIRVGKKGQRDVKYYFDKKTHLLAKSEMQTVDPTTDKEGTQEKIVLDYQDKNGLKVGKRVEILKDGMPFMNFEVSEVQVFDKLDDKVFAMP